MNTKSLHYWIFTSGEQGIHGLDWGIKHASEYFVDRQKLDTDYRALLKDFGLPPSLERPASEVGLVLLPWDKSDFIAGFVFSGTDHGARPNTSSIICVISSELVGLQSADELLEKIWRKNDIPEIARKNSQNRPDTLRIYGEDISRDVTPYFKNSINWPSVNNGWLQIDGELRELSRVNSVQPPVARDKVETRSQWKMKSLLVLIAVIVVFSGAKIFTRNSGVPVDVQTLAPSDISGENTSNDNSADEQEKTAEQQAEERITELNEKLTQLFENGEIIKVEDKKAYLRVKNLDKQLYSDCESIIGRARLVRAGSRITITLRKAVTNNSNIDEIIKALITQTKEEN